MAGWKRASEIIPGDFLVNTEGLAVRVSAVHQSDELVVLELEGDDKMEVSADHEIKVTDQPMGQN